MAAVEQNGSVSGVCEAKANNLSARQIAIFFPEVNNVFNIQLVSFF